MFKSIIHTLGSKLSIGIINLLIAISISQYLGADAKGLQGLIIASMAYILIISNIVGGASIVYLSPRNKLRHILAPSYLWAIIASTIAYFGLQWSSFIEAEYIPYVVLITLISSITSINSSILIGRENVHRSNIVATIQPALCLLILLLFFFVLKRENIESYLYALLFSCLVALGLSTYYFFKLPHLKSESTLKRAFLDLFKYGILNQLSHIFQVLSFRLGYFWLAQVSTRAEVGVFSNAVSVIESIWILSRALSVVQYSKIVNSKNKIESQRITLQFSKIASIASVIGCTVFALMPASFYTFIFGAEFSEMSNLIKLLSPGIVFFSVYIIISHYFSGTGRYDLNAWISLLGLSITIASLYTLSPIYGMIGVALSHMISYVATAILAALLFYFR